MKNKLGVELMNNIEIVPVKQEIDEYKEDIETMEYLQMEKINSNEVCIEFSKRLVGNLKKYINYNCTYTVNIKNGSLINSGYVICDDNLNFIAFASNY